MKNSNFIKNTILSFVFFASTFNSFGNELPNVTIHCSRYSGSIYFGGHYIEWGFTRCDNPEANTSWFDVYVG